MKRIRSAAKRRRYGGSARFSKREAKMFGSRQLDFFRGTLAPFLRASDRPIAMACLRLFTRPPLPPLPERNVPRFLLRIALATVLLAPLLYLRREPDLLAAMIFSSSWLD